MFRRIIHIFVVLSFTLTLLVISPSSSASAGQQRVTKIAINQMRYVATTGSDTANDCTVISSPCATVIHAVNEATSGDTISIATGTYIETGTISVSKDLQFIGAGIDQSILDGGGTHRVVYAPAATISFTDLTIQNGNTSLSLGGGGIRSGGDLTLTRVKITNNSTTSTGGGIGAFGDLMISDSTISNNHATGIGELTYGYGGGIYFNGIGLTVTITNTTISGNTAADIGGGIHNQGDLPLYLTLIPPKYR